MAAWQQQARSAARKSAASARGERCRLGNGCCCAAALTSADATHEALGVAADASAGRGARAAAQGATGSDFMRDHESVSLQGAADARAEEGGSERQRSTASKEVEVQQEKG